MSIDIDTAREMMPLFNNRGIKASFNTKDKNSVDVQILEFSSFWALAEVCEVLGLSASFSAVSGWRFDRPAASVLSYSPAQAGTGRGDESWVEPPGQEQLQAVDIPIDSEIGKVETAVKETIQGVGLQGKVCWKGHNPAYSHRAHEWKEDFVGGYRLYWCPGTA